VVVELSLFFLPRPKNWACAGWAASAAMAITARMTPVAFNCRSPFLSGMLVYACPATRSIGIAKELHALSNVAA
jgi:hypothetical protein